MDILLLFQIGHPLHISEKGKCRFIKIARNKTQLPYRRNRLSYLRVCLFLVRQPPPTPPVGHGLLIHEVSRSHTTTHHSRQGSSGRVISSSQRPLPDNTQHSQQTNVHAPGGIRTHNLSSRAAADLRLRSRGHWDRLKYSQDIIINSLGKHRWSGVQRICPILKKSEFEPSSNNCT